jgi:hypothetical protein
MAEGTETPAKRKRSSTTRRSRPAKKAADAGAEGNGDAAEETLVSGAVAARTAETITRKFFDDLSGIQGRVQDRLTRASRKLSSMAPDVQTRVRAEAVGVVSEYTDRLKLTWGNPDALSRLNEANRDYVAGLQSVQSTAEKELESALRDYADALAEVPEVAQTSVQDAYSRYLDKLLEVLGSLDAETVEPETLAALGQSMWMVALYARAGMGR